MLLYVTLRRKDTAFFRHLQIFEAFFTKRTFVSAAGGTFETVMPGTFHSATGGTFETVLGGTIKPLPSCDHQKAKNRQI